MHCLAKYWEVSYIINSRDQRPICPFSLFRMSWNFGHLRASVVQTTVMLLLASSQDLNLYILNILMANSTSPCDQYKSEKIVNKILQDEQHYPARVTALGPNTAVVMFTEYDNYEEVSNSHCSNKKVRRSCLIK